MVVHLFAYEERLRDAGQTAMETLSGVNRQHRPPTGEEYAQIKAEHAHGSAKEAAERPVTASGERQKGRHTLGGALCGHICNTHLACRE